MLISEALQQAGHTLAAAGVNDPAVDAELLLAHIMGQSRGQVQADLLAGRSIDSAAYEAFSTAVSRRAQREPLQHITGHAYFRHLTLRVGPGVFIPRPETEIVAQFAIDALVNSADPEPIAVDFGTGSGAVAIAMATEVPHARVFAAEVSSDAYAWAIQNSEGVPNLRIVNSDLGEAFSELYGTVSVLISNPPYIPTAAIPRDPEVRLFDPERALYGGVDGLDVIRVVSRRGLELLHQGGLLVLEHGEAQGEEIRALLRADGWSAPRTHPDLTLRDRATTAIRP